MKPAASPQSERAKLLAFRALAVFVVVALAEAVIIQVLWTRWREASGPGGADWDPLKIPAGNLIKHAYPEVDFLRVYPGLTELEIDLIQREAFALPYRHEPFVGFSIAPTNGRSYSVSPAGFRVGASPAPWPPDPSALNVFVFGGSTTFGCAVRGQDTLPAMLQAELQRAFPSNRFQCYNFGCGYYFSTQERLRFEQLLAVGHVPRLAVFVDGLNDFYFLHGIPEFSSRIANAFPGSKPITLPDASTPERADALLDGMLARYQANVRMIDVIAQAWQVEVLMVGQPVPFRALPRTPAVYPFPLPTRQHPFAAAAYDRFEALALAGHFGSRFLWCGDAFAKAKTIMYADSIHYSPEGNQVLANLIVERAKARGLLKL